MRCAVEECSNEMRRSAAVVEKVLAADLPGKVGRGMKEAGEAAEDAARAIGTATEKAVQSLAEQQRETTEVIAAQLKSHRELIAQQRRDYGGIRLPAVFFYAMVCSLIFLTAFLAVTMFANHELFHIAKLETLTWAFITIITVCNGIIAWFGWRYGRDWE